MDKKFLGTQYGGWVIDIDSINDGDTIICGGAGEDITFEEALMKHKKVKIIEVDPTVKSHKFLESKLKQYDNITLIKSAIEVDGVELITLFKNSNKDHVSESVFNEHTSVVNNGTSYETPCISIKTLREKYNPSFIKIDIEGSEYNVIDELIGVKQICIEFHHHCITGKTSTDTNNIVTKFINAGYEVIDNRNLHEITFLKK